MPSKWDRVRDTFQRAHDDLQFELCTFYNYTTSFDQEFDDQTITQSNSWQANCSVSRPSNSDFAFAAYGTDAEIDIVLRAKKSETFISNLNTASNNSEYISQVEIASGRRFKIIDTIFEQDSGFVAMPCTEAEAP